MPPGVKKTDFPALLAWHEKMMAVPFIKQAQDERAAMLAAPKA